MKVAKRPQLICKLWTAMVTHIDGRPTSNHRYNDWYVILSFLIRIIYCNIKVISLAVRFNYLWCFERVVYLSIKPQLLCTRLSPDFIYWNGVPKRSENLHHFCWFDYDTLRIHVLLKLKQTICCAKITKLMKIMPKNYSFRITVKSGASHIIPKMDCPKDLYGANVLFNLHTREISATTSQKFCYADDIAQQQRIIFFKKSI